MGRGVMGRGVLGRWVMGRWAVGAVAGIAAIALAGCGSAQAPGTGSTTAPVTSAPVRPVSDQPTAPDGALDCPASLTSPEGMTVPQQPQGNVDGNARLLPDRAATSMVVCAYPVMDIAATQPLTPPFTLTQRTVASPEQRRNLTDLLAWAPRWNGQPQVCTMMAGNETAYLVGSRYTDAIVWVAAKDDPNSCSHSTNGDFGSGEALGVTIHAMFGGGKPAQTPTDPCFGSLTGRLGDDQSLAPEGDPNVTVCRIAADSTYHATPLAAERSKQVVAELRGLKSEPTGHTCEGSGKVSSSRFTLLLSYDAGPQVRIQVDPECAPQVLGNGLQADEASSLVRLVEQWSAPIPGPDPNGSVSSGHAGTVTTATVPAQTR
ncbi:hypothetical protein ACWEOW_11645 [Monashia sp. NPDC004114]